MAEKTDKVEKKRAKADAKTAKAAAKARSDGGKVPDGTGVAIHKTDSGTQLTVTGLTDEQLQRLVPQIEKEVLISVTEDSNTLKAALMRFVREGFFQTIIKVVAGLIVGYILIKLGLG